MMLDAVGSKLSVPPNMVEEMGKILRILVVYQSVNKPAMPSTPTGPATDEHVLDLDDLTRKLQQISTTQDLDEILHDVQSILVQLKLQ